MNIEARNHQKLEELSRNNPGVRTTQEVKFKNIELHHVFSMLIKERFLKEQN